ncbi:amidohydrolase family protein [Marinimicrobium alkaliphilum]|uniref:amidohydrolase family protein n=1 Tax=Marinimicrobium alkaliphilum TaxID=2202654 RepID=UPI000DBA1E24|nr:amidohydrolase family protein [Marinimicrobium alkaliphilum]
MKRVLFAVIAMLPLVSGCGQGAVSESDPEPGAYVFENVNVVPMDEERVLENRSVVVRDGRIEALLAPGEPLPANAVRIPAEGRYLMPGMAEMHGHVPGDDNPRYAQDVLFLYISNGVTLVRGMAGHPYHIDVRERLAAGELEGPTLYTASPWTGQHNAGSESQARAAVRQFHEQGFDLMKIGGPSPINYRHLADEANQVGLPFGGHIPTGVSLEHALAVGQVSVDHLDRYVEFLVAEDADLSGRAGGFFGSGLIDLVDRERIPAVVDLTVESGVWNVPTLSLVEHLASDEAPEAMAEWPEMRYLPPRVIEGWVRAKHDYQAREDFQPEAAQALVELRRELLKALHDGGARIAFGSDAPQFFNVPGFSMHHEAEMMVAAGLSPYDVLVTGTRRAAEYFALDDAGQVQPGYRADLILLDRNPLEAIEHLREPAGVMVRGRWYPQDEIAQRLAEIAGRHE